MIGLPYLSWRDLVTTRWQQMDTKVALLYCHLVAECLQSKYGSSTSGWSPFALTYTSFLLQIRTILPTCDFIVRRGFSSGDSSLGISFITMATALSAALEPFPYNSEINNGLCQEETYDIPVTDVEIALIWHYYHQFQFPSSSPPAKETNKKQEVKLTHKTVEANCWCWKQNCNF